MHFLVHFSSAQLFGVHSCLGRHGSVALENMLAKSLRLRCQGGNQRSCENGITRQKAIYHEHRYCVCVGAGGRGDPVVPSHLVVQKAILLLFSLLHNRFVLRRQRNVIKLKRKWKRPPFIPPLSSSALLEFRAGSRFVVGNVWTGFPLGEVGSFFEAKFQFFLHGEKEMFK